MEIIRSHSMKNMQIIRSPKMNLKIFGIISGILLIIVLFRYVNCSVKKCISKDIALWGIKLREGDYIEYKTAHNWNRNGKILSQNSDGTFHILQTDGIITYNMPYDAIRPMLNQQLNPPYECNHLAFFIGVTDPPSVISSSKEYQRIWKEHYCDLYLVTNDRSQNINRLNDISPMQNNDIDNIDHNFQHDHLNKERKQKQQKEIEKDDKYEVLSNHKEEVNSQSTINQKENKINEPASKMQTSVQVNIQPIINQKETNLAHQLHPKLQKSVRVLFPRGIALRKDPIYPGQRTGEDIPFDAAVDVLEERVVMYYGRYITFYKLSDDRGWLHNYNPDTKMTNTLQIINIQENSKSINLKKIIICSKTVKILKEPVYPGKPTGEELSYGQVLKFDDTRMVKWNMYFIKFYELKDNRGWIHNYDSEWKGDKPSVEEIVNPKTMSCKKLIHDKYILFPYFGHATVDEIKWYNENFCNDQLREEGEDSTLRHKAHMCKFLEKVYGIVKRRTIERKFHNWGNCPKEEKRAYLSWQCKLIDIWDPELQIDNKENNDEDNF